MKRTLAVLLALAMIFTLGACNKTDEVDPDPTPTPDQSQAPEADVYEDYDVRSMAGQWEYHEVLNVGGENKYVEIPYYSLENVVYCTNPVDETYQTMNIYVPACYMTEVDGGYGSDEKGLFGVSGQDGSTIFVMTEEAPIIYWNSVTGYAAGLAGTIGNTRPGQNSGYYYQFLEQGFVVVLVGSRGRTSTDENGNINGLVPEGLTDLKAGVRWLKYNDDFLAGDSDKIISVGVSAGGGMSAMLGATGNSPLFDPYLERIGALNATDNIWASVDYCPITNLEFGDGGSEWQNGVKAPGTTDMMGNPLDELTIALSQAVYDEYVAYMQELGFDLTDDGRGGAFYEDWLAAWEDSFNSYIEHNYANKPDEAAEFIRKSDPTGTWLTWDAETGAHITSVDDYVDNMFGGTSMGGDLIPVYDTPDYSSMEGQVFGNKHFSWLVRDALGTILDVPGAQELYDAYTADLENGGSELGELYDPLAFIVKGESTVAPYWRFRIGGADSNVAQSHAWALHEALQKYRTGEASTDYAICYGIGHQVVEYNPYDLIDWVYEIGMGAVPAYGNIKQIITVTDPSTAGQAQDPSTVAGTYTLTEVNGAGMEVTWTLELKADGTYALSEKGVVEATYTGKFCVVDGLVSCGPINEAVGPRGDAFGDGYISVWTVNTTAGTCAHADVTRFTDPDTAVVGGGAAAVAISGTFTLSETNAMGMDISWTLELNEDGTYALSEEGVVAKTYTGVYIYDGTYVSCGPINEADGPRGNDFGEDRGWISVWTVNTTAGTCAHAALSFYTDPSSAPAGGGTGTDVTGTYTLSEVNAMGMAIDWTLELKADGTYVLSESGIMEKSYTGSYTNDGTTVSCGPINEADGPRGDAFAEDAGWYSVWTVNADGTMAHGPLGQYKAPSGGGAPVGGGEARVDVVGIYTLSETNAMGMNIDWTLELRADNTYVLSESGIMEKRYTGNYTHDGTTVFCGPINEADGPRGGDFAEDSGWYSVWIVNTDGTCAHGPLGQYKAP